MYALLICPYAHLLYYICYMVYTLVYHAIDDLRLTKIDIYSMPYALPILAL